MDESEKDRAMLQLLHSMNKHVMMNRASAEDYVQGDRPAETDEDEPGFGFEAGDDQHQQDDDAE